jgi:hypothetical protein
MQAVELLKSGMLTDKELLHMAADYEQAGNNTMRRLCANAAKERPGKDMQALAATASRTGRQDLKLIDDLQTASMYAFKAKPSRTPAVYAACIDAYDSAIEQAHDVYIDEPGLTAGSHITEA